MLIYAVTVHISKNSPHIYIHFLSSGRIIMLHTVAKRLIFSQHVDALRYY